MFWVLGGPIAVLLFAVFLASQVVYPAFTGAPYFWMFRKSHERASNASDKNYDAKLDRTTRKVKRQTKKLNNK